MIKSFNVSIVVDTEHSKVSMVIPKGMEKFMGTDNVFTAVKEVASTKMCFRQWEEKLVKTVSVTTKVLRTCCGCEEKTFHNSQNECVICGRTNQP